jgi:CheY-like chemotaxis protein
VGSALAKLGYAMALASDGETGLAEVFADPPDLVLYDVSTLRMGDLEACLGLLEQLSKAGPRSAEVPFSL